MPYLLTFFANGRPQNDAKMIHHICANKEANMIASSKNMFILLNFVQSHKVKLDKIQQNALLCWAVKLIFE